jgi:hypothetical protein
VSTTPTAAPPAWLEAAAKLDAIAADRVPLADAPPAPAPAAPAPPKTAALETRPRQRIAATPVIIPDVSEGSPDEIEIGWHGYSVVTLLPEAAVLAALTVGAIASLRPLVPAAVMREAVDAPLAALWLIQAIRAAYRLLAYQYRLTTRRLFRERGRLYPPEAPLDLATVARTEVKQPLIGRLLGVGMVRVVPEEGAGRPVLELPGVHRPRAFAAAIELAAAAAREGNVVAVRVKGDERADGSSRGSDVPPG